MISKEEIEKVAKLACLSLTENEKTEALSRFEKILKAFAELEKVDTTGVEPLFHLKDSIDFRNDEVHENLSTNDFLKNVTDSADDYVKISEMKS
jgi:aspartyl-tRNA(Asn)/glutamyl-tRNA(Gln) amidotransferase subunit C